LIYTKQSDEPLLRRGKPGFFRHGISNWFLWNLLVNDNTCSSLLYIFCYITVLNGSKFDQG